MQQTALPWKSSDPAWIATFITILVSIWIIATDDLINSDGVLYIEVAESLFQGEWAAGIEQFRWPFYSLLIAMVSKITFLSLETSANILNVLTQALLTFMFVRCAQALGGNHRVALFAAILIITNVTINGYRDQIIRDFGYWAFFFTALYYFIRYQEVRIPKYAIAFSVSMIIATLFRIEGIVFLIGAPLLIFFYSKKHKENAYSAALLFAPVILLTSITFIVILVTEVPEHIGRITDPVLYLKGAYQNIITGISEKGRLLEDSVLLSGAKDMGTESMFAILFMMLTAKIISASGIIPLYFSMTSYASNSMRNTISRLNIINGFMIINLAVLVVFLLSHSFLSPRYTMTMALLMSLPASFGLAHFMENNINDAKWHKRGKVLVLVMLSYMFLDGVTSFGESKEYIKEAGMWVSENASENARVAASERSLYYYAGKPANINIVSAVAEDLRASKLLKIDKNEYDYLLIGVSRKQIAYDKKLMDWVGSKPIYQTSNERGDKVLVFKLNQ